jgi:hypothetical protein
MLKGGQDGNREDMRFAKFVLVVMGIARVGTKSDYACEEAYEKATDLRALIESIPVNVTRFNNCYCCATVVTNKRAWLW